MLKRTLSYDQSGKQNKKQKKATLFQTGNNQEFRGGIESREEKGQKRERGGSRLGWQDY